MMPGPYSVRKADWLPVTVPGDFDRTEFEGGEDYGHAPVYALVERFCAAIGALCAIRGWTLADYEGLCGCCDVSQKPEPGAEGGIAWILGHSREFWDESMIADARKALDIAGIDPTWVWFHWNAPPKVETGIMRADGANEG